MMSFKLFRVYKRLALNLKASVARFTHIFYTLDRIRIGHRYWVSHGWTHSQRPKING